MHFIDISSFLSRKACYVTARPRKKISSGIVAVGAACSGDAWSSKVRMDLLPRKSPEGQGKARREAETNGSGFQPQWVFAGPWDLVFSTRRREACYVEVRPRRKRFSLGSVAAGAPSSRDALSSKVRVDSFPREGANPAKRGSEETPRRQVVFLVSRTDSCRHFCESAFANPPKDRGKARREAETKGTSLLWERGSNRNGFSPARGIWFFSGIRPFLTWPVLYRRTSL